MFGGTLAWVSEIDRDASQVLAHHAPHVPNLGDLTTVDWAEVEPVDVLTAGFPCQPVSSAGKRKGTDDERWLWDDIAAAVSRMVAPPRVLVLENVAGLLSANDGDAMARVVHGLAALGYVGAWRVVRASDVGACHQRARVFIVAGHTERGGRMGWRRSELAGGGGAPVEAGRPERFTEAVDGGAGKGHRHASHADDDGDTQRGRAGRGVAGTPGAGEGGDRERQRVRDALGHPRQDAPHADGAAGGQPGAAGETVRAPGAVERPGRRRGVGGGQDAAHPDGGGLEVGGERHRRQAGGLAAPLGDDAHRRGETAPHAQVERGADEPAGGNQEGQPLGAVVGAGDRAGAGDRPEGVRFAGRDTGIVAWGEFTAAIRRHTEALGRPAPPPTDGRRLNPAFVEWMQMLPEGWVTGVPGLSRTAQLRILGNGVVPPQAEHAIRLLLADLTVMERVA